MAVVNAGLLPGDSPSQALSLQFPLPSVTAWPGVGIALGIAGASSFSFPEGRSGGAVDSGFLSRPQNELAGLSHLTTAKPVVLTSNGSF